MKFALFLISSLMVMSLQASQLRGSRRMMDIMVEPDSYGKQMDSYGGHPSAPTGYGQPTDSYGSHSAPQKGY